MATNNNGNLLDTAGNVVVDFVWGNVPMQPNDERADAAYSAPPVTEVVANNAAQNKSWSGYSMYPSARLNAALSNHAVAEAKWSGYPSFVANSAGAGIAYITVPNILGLTTALGLDALKDAGYEAANITTAAAATNAAKVVTEAARSAGVATFQITTSTAHGYVAGNKVTLTGVDDTVNGTWTVGAVTSTTFEVLGTATTVLSLTELTGAVVAVSGTIKAQSTAAGTASVATTATITVTPWA